MDELLVRMWDRLVRTYNAGLDHSGKRCSRRLSTRRIRQQACDMQTSLMHVWTSRRRLQFGPRHTDVEMQVG